MTQIVRHEPKSILSKSVEHGNTVYLSGITAEDKSKGIQEQTADILKTIDRLLALSGSGKGKVLAATIWLSDIGDRPAMNDVWVKWADPANLPARACVEAKMGDRCLVEIQVTAAK